MWCEGHKMEDETQHRMSQWVTILSGDLHLQISDNEMNAVNV